jgi:hypothetical protein
MVREWRVGEDSKREKPRYGIIKNTNSAAEHNVLPHTQWLPSEAKPRRPHEVGDILIRLFEIDENGLIIWLIGVTTD